MRTGGRKGWAVVMSRHDSDVRREAVVCESAAVALRAFRKSGVEAGDKLLIYGIGRISLFIAQWAKAAGVKSIVLVDRADEKVELAQKMGIAMAVRQGKLSEVMVADACIECTGTSEGLTECIGHVRAGGIVVCVGAPSEGVDFSQDIYLGLRQKELTLVGVAIENAREMEEWEAASEVLQVKNLREALLRSENMLMYVN